MTTILVSVGRYVFGALLVMESMDTFAADAAPESLDRELRSVLAKQGFTGRVESTLERRLGRPVDPAKAELGRLLFFDKFVGLHGDNSCAGCHSSRASSIKIDAQQKAKGWPNFFLRGVA